MLNWPQSLFSHQYSCEYQTSLCPQLPLLPQPFPSCHLWWPWQPLPLRPSCQAGSLSRLARTGPRLRRLLRSSPSVFASLTRKQRLFTWNVIRATELQSVGGVTHICNKVWSCSNYRNQTGQKMVLLAFPKGQMYYLHNHNYNCQICLVQRSQTENSYLL